MTTATVLTEAGTSKTVFAGGMNIHYHDVGKGPAVVMLHAYGPGTTGWINFHKVLPEFSKHFRCIVMDLPNFAKTGPVVYHEPVHNFQAKTALALMDALGIQKASFVGDSQGGQSSMIFAYKYPDRIDKLVWGSGHIGTGGDRYLLGNRPSEGSRATREFSQNPSLETARRYLRVHIDDEKLVTDDLVEYIYKSATGRPDLAEARKQSSSTQYDHSHDIENIKAPTLIIWGRYDRMCVFEIGINALNHIANSRMVLLANCGHWPPFEKPKEYSSHVINFLQGGWA
jgi:2-hydroxymuconate-semialdehyde hydrolase